MVVQIRRTATTGGTASVGIRSRCRCCARWIMWWGEKVGGEELEQRTKQTQVAVSSCASSGSRPSSKPVADVPRRAADRWLIERNSVAVLPDEIDSVGSSGRGSSMYLVTKVIVEPQKHSSSSVIGRLHCRSAMKGTLLHSTKEGPPTTADGEVAAPMPIRSSERGDAHNRRLV